MSGYLDDLDRKRHHRQPRDTRGHWANAGARHPGIDPARCPDCQEARDATE